MLDGEYMAERCVVVALAITADGMKVPVGLWDGSTENKTVVRALLADLVDRGLDFDDGLLVVIDGAKALSAAVREVFGDKALIQRCTLHKRRNIADHLPDKEKAWVDAKLVKAFNHPDPDAGLRNAKSLATQLQKSHPRAAASLREGLEEMFTVNRLGLDGRLARTLTTSNPIESMISIAKATNRNVTRWRDGQMVLRWTAAGMLNAERSFRRIKGYKQMPQLVAALKPTRPPRHRHRSVPPPRVTMDRHPNSTQLGTRSSVTGSGSSTTGMAVRDQAIVGLGGQVFMRANSQDAVNEFRPYFDNAPVYGHGPSLEEFTAQTPLTVGSPQQVIDRTLGFREYVGDYQRQLFLVDHAGLPLKTVLEQLDLLGGEVVPVLRKEFQVGRPADVAAGPTHESLVKAAARRTGRNDDAGSHQRWVARTVLDTPSGRPDRHRGAQGSGRDRHVGHLDDDRAAAAGSSDHGRHADGCCRTGVGGGVRRGCRCRRPDRRDAGVQRLVQRAVQVVLRRATRTDAMATCRS